MTSVRMAIDSILEKKGRSFLTMLGIIIGVTAVLVLVALVEGYNADMTAYYEKMGVNKVEVSLSWLDATRAEDFTDDLRAYASTEMSDYVTGISPYLTSSSATIRYSDYMTSSSTDVVLTNEDYGECGNYTLELGRDILSYDLENRSRVCIIGSYVDQTLFEYTNPVGSTVLINGSPYTVIGTYYQKDGGTEGSMDDVVVLPYTLNREFLSTDYVSSFIVKVDSSTMMDTAMTYVEYWFYENTSDTVVEYEVENGNSAMSASQDEMTSMSVVLGGIAGIALLVGGIGIMNIMLVTVSERTREIGIKKAIGAPESDIITQFMVEAGILSAIGGLIGVALGYFLSAILGKIMYDLITLPNTLVSMGAFIFAVAIGMIFGLYPAVKAAQLQPVDALRND
ncbi:ABC transporter permease [Bengtsoniella intestinalis]|uniref:ABC transporter permease n=1 Tax=Bengtsoniella intestinalis TaxID=3073143 RepID=UPI00391EFD3D